MIGIDAFALLGEASAKTEWAGACLSARKGHVGTIGVARRLRNEKTMTFGWIARRPQMGSWTYVSNLLNSKPRQRV
jgi:hypothetical protein